MTNTDTLQIVATIIILGISIVTIAIKNTFEKEKRLAEFRSKLKPGDETREGVVIEIDGHHVITEKTTHIENIEPLIIKI